MDDGRGRCSGCFTQARGLPAWPCGIRRLADAASSLRATWEDRGVLERVTPERYDDDPDQAGTSPAR
ncbi:hypothetical protein AFB00_23725 [Pseudonocardia sp. HH130630-07]|nr:hypothetical protein AFB00_23725 [Pseudonocardia sp. HH130630-07]